MRSAIFWFHNGWSGAEVAELTGEETELIVAALGAGAKRWDGEPDEERLVSLLGANANVLQRIGPPLLHVAIHMRGCAATVKHLLAAGVPLELDESAYNVLHEAAWAGAADTLRAVFEAGAADATCVAVKKPHTGWPDNVSLMYWAAYGGFQEVAKLLLQYGAAMHHELPIKGNGERGVTSLHEAVAPSPWAEKVPARTQDKLAVARILIDSGAYYDIYTACALDDTARLQTLLAEAPDAVNAVEDYGMTPLHWAARAGAMGCSTMLLEQGAEVDARNKAQRVPLHLAAEAVHDAQTDVVRLLAKYGADLNAQDKKGRTPLHRATYEGRAKAAEALLAAGADPKLPNKSGKTALEIARKGAKYMKTM